MDISIRPIEPEEFDAFVKAVETAFSHHPDAESTELWRSITEFDRSLVAFDGGRMAGTTVIDSMSLTVPGGEIAMAGVTAVGVLPSYRRRGILTSLMRRQLQDVRDRGEALAGLWASEGSIYGRFGYGLSCFVGRVEADRDRARFVNTPDDPGIVHLVEKDEALPAMREVYERLRPTRSGMISRSEGFWRVEHADLERWRDGASALFFALHETSGQVDGFVTYRVKSDWNDGMPGGTVLVRNLFGMTPGAYAALWRFVFGIDLMAKVDAWGRPSDEPLLMMVAEPRRLRFRLTDALYLRIVDVPAALSARTYAAEGTLVFEVADAFCPWVEGRYALESGPDGASCVATTSAPDLRLSVRELGAAYLGGVTFGSLAAAGRVEEERPAALTLAGRMFAADPPPWCPLVF